MKTLRLLLLTSAFAATLLVGAFAQRPSAWAEVQLAGPVQAASVRQLGKTCVVREGTTLLAFSGFTKQWTPLQGVPVTATLSVFNDMAFAVEVARISAFSAYRGRFESIAITSAAQVINPPTQSNDSTLVVRDGATLWTFSAFTGVWMSRALSSAQPIIAVQRHVVVLADGGTFSGFSAFRGRWIDAQASDVAIGARANGAWGVIEGQAAIHGFSAQREIWSRSTWPMGSLQTFAQEELVLYAGATDAVAYSGLAGGFSSITLPLGATMYSNSMIAVAQSGTDLYCYSAVLGEWSHAVASAASIVLVLPQVALAYDLSIGVISAYSPFTGEMRTAPIRTTTFQASQACAFALADPNGKPLLYSSLVGEWCTAPSEVKPGLPPLTWCGSLLQTTTGYVAFSSRTGRFVPIATQAGAVVHIDANSSVIALEETNALHVFDARFDRWITQAKQNPTPLNVLIWRTTLLAIDGSTVHGFGSLSGEVESLVLPGVTAIAAANSESARVGAGTTLAAFGGTSDLTTLYQFPEFRRVFTIGSVLELQLAAEPASLALLAMGSAMTSAVHYPGVGSWWIDPATATYLPFAIPSHELRAVLRFDVPADPWLRGIEPKFQALVQPPQGQLYATRLTSVGLR